MDQDHHGIHPGHSVQGAARRLRRGPRRSMLEAAGIRILEPCLEVNRTVKKHRYYPYTSTEPNRSPGLEGWEGP